MTRSTPSFAGLKPASINSSKTKKANRSTDTEHELVLRKVLWRLGARYRKNVKSLPGKPDIVFWGPRVAVFCDGDFWHGRNWIELRAKLESGTNAGYWSSKIAKNIERDERNSAILQTQGWKVIRLWENDIKRDPHTLAQMVLEAVNERRSICRKLKSASVDARQ